MLMPNERIQSKKDLKEWLDIEVVKYGRGGGN